MVVGNNYLVKVILDIYIKFTIKLNAVKLANIELEVFVYIGEISS